MQSWMRRAATWVHEHPAVLVIGALLGVALVLVGYLQIQNAGEPYIPPYGQCIRVPGEPSTPEACAARAAAIVQRHEDQENRSQLIQAGGVLLIVTSGGLLAYRIWERRTRRPRCPWCASRIRPEAVVCPACRRDIQATSEPESDARSSTDE
jgi:hypothetical protein